MQRAGVGVGALEGGDGETGMGSVLALSGSGWKGGEMGGRGMLSGASKSSSSSSTQPLPPESFPSTVCKEGNPSSPSLCRFRFSLAPSQGSVFNKVAYLELLPVKNVTTCLLVLLA